MAKESQKEIWNKLACSWAEYKDSKGILKEVPEFLEDKKGKILDLGCGSGRYFKFFNENSEIYGIDFSINMVNIAKKKIIENKKNGKIISNNSIKLPYKDNFFDSAIYIAALHCIEEEKDRKKSLEELYRVLKPKSSALISVWSKNHKRIKNKSKEQFIPWTINGIKYPRFYYIFDKEELISILNKIGFKIINSKEEDNIFVEVEK